MQHHKYSLSDLENMMPFERQVYIYIINAIPRTGKTTTSTTKKIMAAGTVGYTDTRGNKDYLSMIASQIKNRVTEASDMASSERQFAEEKAEEGGTSLDEAG